MPILICANCGEVIGESEPEAVKEAEAELARDYPQFNKEECSVVCDECYKKIKRWERYKNN